ncbi:hypothetical protein BaRGS_00006688 [Batillaria attramentaria]|uniref:Uncharacterized protein n=1 Tax=Batillaria attramentaria TaxID=370345 RepID=A0ABD0LRZ7_9CAEN
MARGRPMTSASTTNHLVFPCQFNFTGTTFECWSGKVRRQKPTLPIDSRRNLHPSRVTCFKGERVLGQPARRQWQGRDPSEGRRR